MIKVQTDFKTEEEKIKYVEKCEGKFDAQLLDAVEKIENLQDVKILALSGPTCSGKTTAAKKLIADFEKIGKSVCVISIDDYFLDRDLESDMAVKESGNKLDYDSINTIDIDYLYENIKSIAKLETFKVPKFDFISGKRVSYSDFDPQKCDYVLFEGIQAIYPEIINKLKELNCVSIFICPADDVEYNGICFDKREIRLMRRLVRDYGFRGAHPEFTFYIWETVIENEDKNIFPNVSNADIVIDSNFGYELGVIKNPLSAVLSLVSENSKYYLSARKLAEKIKYTEEISHEYIPDNSLFKEFLK